MRMRRLTLATPLALLAALTFFVGSAIAGTFHSGTLAIGADASSAFDSAGARWRVVGADNKNPIVMGTTISRITFIDSGGSWSCSSDSYTNHSCILTSPNFQKKGYCKNIGFAAYSVRCFVTT